ncbi:hypothetical protein BgAZ_209370 [Babesia gibsoni]|uniref:Uncharacterized protein n=1 Tax=Babesia gibsoni TaxID=33632 RepID=A0AAD8PEU3_BABGI|nr:hypothetical protein BgAZ_209370 [Babesia gibsoni]
MVPPNVETTLDTVRAAKLGINEEQNNEEYDTLDNEGEMTNTDLTPTTNTEYDGDVTTTEEAEVKEAPKSVDEPESVGKAGEKAQEAPKKDDKDAYSQKKDEKITRPSGEPQHKLVKMPPGGISTSKFPQMRD